MSYAPKPQNPKTQLTASAWKSIKRGSGTKSNFYLIMRGQIILRTGSGQPPKKSAPKTPLHARGASNSPMQFKGLPKEKQIKHPSSLMIGGNLVQSFVDSHHHPSPVRAASSSCSTLTPGSSTYGRLRLKATRASTSGTALRKYRRRPRTSRANSIQRTSRIATSSSS